ncbi:hypothetical protein QTL95_15865 [Rhizobium sp. S152]|uniref:hypothetical protein n=1 Tax=Rhizobium sp. S152 TaxID=3055038 RepID=UPI0025A97A27|nr:hypothetical protein [Rhizobium sp. S152]MDM9627385.1 hypothetical protein [Rhizobium sp. S152]
MAEYPFDIDVITFAGQLRVLRLWSAAELDITVAALILKMPIETVLDLASRNGIEPPTDEALDRHIRGLEVKIRPQLRRAKRDRTERQFADIHAVIMEALDHVASIALEAEAYEQAEASQLYSVAHARLRRALDEVASAQEKFKIARRTENERVVDAEYDHASLKVLCGLDRVVPRPDYYLIGDFNHIEPVTEHDILWSWSRGFLTTRTAEEMLALEEGDTLNEVAAQLGVPFPREEALSPAAAAVILGDRPVDGDLTFDVRRRIRDARLASYFRSDVEARRAFEDKARAGR